MIWLAPNFPLKKIKKVEGFFFSSVCRRRRSSSSPLYMGGVCVCVCTCVLVSGVCSQLIFCHVWGEVKGGGCFDGICYIY